MDRTREVFKVAPAGRGEVMQIRLGALAPKLSKQLDAVGITNYDEEYLEVFQRDADSISRLSIRGFITDTIAEKARKRLIKKLAEWINQRP